LGSEVLVVQFAHLVLVQPVHSADLGLVVQEQHQEPEERQERHLGLVADQEREERQERLPLAFSDRTDKTISLWSSIKRF
jgi:cobyrinic acid a,c-diamide synthase